MDTNKEVHFDCNNHLLIPVEPTTTSPSGVKSPTSLTFFIDRFAPGSDRFYDTDDGRRGSADSIDVFQRECSAIADEHVAIIRSFSKVEENWNESGEKRSVQFTSFLPASSDTAPPVDATSSDKPSAKKIRREFSRQTTTQQCGWRRALGPILALAAAFFISISSVASKFLLNSFDTPQIGVFRFASLCLITTPFMLHKRINPFSLRLLNQFGWLLLLRACAGSSAFFCLILAFSKLPLGDATTIMFISPVFVGVLARVCLHEKYRKRFFLSALMATAGCVLISRPQFLGFTRSVQHNISSGDRTIGSPIAIASALSNAVVVVLLRKLRKVPAQIIIFYFGLVGTVISVVLCVSTSTPIAVPTTFMHWVWILVLALASNLGQWLFTTSLHYENANVISLVRASDILWAFAAQILIFDHVPHWLSICGAVLVCSGVGLLAVFKIFESLRRGKEKVIGEG